MTTTDRTALLRIDGINRPHRASNKAGRKVLVTPAAPDHETPPG